MNKTDLDFMDWIRIPLFSSVNSIQFFPMFSHTHNQKDFRFLTHFSQQQLIGLEINEHFPDKKCLPISEQLLDFITSFALKAVHAVRIAYEMYGPNMQIASKSPKFS